MTLKTKAIVLNSLSYSDSDLIVTFLSPEQGIIKGMAKGARKSRKRFAGCFEPFNLLSLEIFIKESGGLARVDSADILDARYGIREDLARINAGALMLELVSALEAPGAGASEVFGLLDTALKTLEGSPDPAGLAAVYAIKYLKLSGYKMPLESCSKCGCSILDKEAVYPGGHDLLCLHCAGRMGGVSISRGGLAFMRRADSIEPAKIGRLRLAPSARRECFLLLRRFIEAVAGKRLKSLDIQAEFC
jgi:DNA repair protein RecO (recombination protein O)